MGGMEERLPWEWELTDQRTNDAGGDGDVRCLPMLIILQYINGSNQHAEHLKLMKCYMIISRLKNKFKKMTTKTQQVGLEVILKNPFSSISHRQQESA